MRGATERRVPASELRYRLDTSAMVERARRLEAEPWTCALPDVAALCLRIGYHAHALGVLERSSTALVDWATSRYEAWANSLHNCDLEVTTKTLASDPVNLLLGALCLPDVGVRERVVSTYLTFACGLNDHGLSVVSLQNAPLVGALLRAMGRGKEAGCLPFCSDSLPILGGDLDGIARYALSVTGFGSRHSDTQEQRLIEPLVEAYLEPAPLQWTPRTW
jgi:hypothetical protein